MAKTDVGSWRYCMTICYQGNKSCRENVFHRKHVLRLILFIIVIVTFIFKFLEILKKLNIFCLIIYSLNYL